MITKIGKHIINTDLITHIYRNHYDGIVTEDYHGGCEETIYICFGSSCTASDSSGELFEDVLKLYNWFLAQCEEL